MQRLGMLDGYMPLSEKEIAHFRHPESSAENARLVKFRVIAENDTALYYAVGDKPKQDGFQLLTVVKAGFEEIEFYILGDFHLAAKGGDLMLSTFDNTVVYLGPEETESFARLWERPEVNPEILEMQRIARHNAELLRAQMAADFAAHEERMRAIRDERPNEGSGSSGKGRVSGSDNGESAGVSVSSGDDGAPAPESGDGGDA